MHFSLLRVSRPDWDAEAFVREHGLTTAPFWRADGLVEDRTSTKSGFNLSIADLSGQSTPVIGEWLRQNQAVLEAIRRVGAKAVLHIGFGVEEREPLMQATLGPTELALLADCGVQLELTAFAKPAEH